LAGLKDGFEGFHTNIDPTINLEFSQSVYRFGHSMLVNTVDRFDADWNTITETHSGDADQLGLFEAFLNPLALFNAGDDGVPTLTAEEGFGSVVRGLTRARANEIDEFVTGAMQTNLVGLPLDIGAINIARGRDVGNPSLNVARKMFFERTLDLRLIPYVHWVDYLDNLRHEPTFVNFLAGYGTHPTLAGGNGIVGDGDDPNTTFADRRAAACAIASVLAADGASDPATYCADTGFGSAPTPGDAVDFLYSRNAWANTVDGESTTGLDDVDFWNGGLAEERMPFGGFLGSTHNYVFEKQIESLQNGDRFYYLGRTNGLNFLAELESNSFTALAMRNTDMGETGGGTIAANIFAKNNHYLEIDQTQQAVTELAEGMMGEMFVGTDDPGPETDLLALVIRDASLVTFNIAVPDPNLFVQYTGGDHVVIGGTNGDDTMIGGIGDDTMWGRGGNDRIEGGDGADHIEGGRGDDIITDLSGPDVIEGGEGNDAISSGNEEDVVFGDAGKDFIVNSSEFGEVFGGEGDDFAIDGDHISKYLMGAGDDWLEELGGGENIHCMDNCKIPESGEPPTFGNDVFVAYGGNNDMDSENGDDIMVDGPGIDRMEGQLGFDWASFQLDPSGIGVDLDLTIFIRPIIPVSNASVSNRYDRIEGLSGSAFGDILRGTANPIDSLNGNELVQTASRDGFALIEGMNDSPGNAGLVPLSERRILAPDPVSGEEQFGWTGGDIILGGGSSDVLVGEAGDDILDGDSALDVALEVAADPDAGHNGLYPGMQSLFDQVFTGQVNPGDIYISRVISDKDIGCTDTDTALYSGNLEDYTVAAAGLSFMRVTDNREIPQNVKAIQGGNDGADLVRNVERLTFADQTMILGVGVGGSCGDINNLATGNAAILGTPELDAVLTADIGVVMDADGFDSSQVSWVWESELDPGSGLFHPIIRATGTLGNGDAIFPQGQEFLVTAAEVGQSIRVLGIFKDNLDVFEVVYSAPVTIAVPPGFEPPPGAPAAEVLFDGACADLEETDPVFRNASGIGMERLDFMVEEVP
ncbi:MAG: peroxidase family protein, partial [Myxococcota bacterium]